MLFLVSGVSDQPPWKNNYSKVNWVTIDLYTGVENTIAFCFPGFTFYIPVRDDLESESLIQSTFILSLALLLLGGFL